LQGKKGGWGAAATGSSAALAAVFFVLITVGDELAYLIACSGYNAVTSRLNDLAWACVVIVSFPAAMLIMAGTFGLWWAGLISKRSSGPDWQRSYSSCWANNVGEVRILGTGRCLFAVHLADHGPLAPRVNECFRLLDGNSPLSR
jgi:hypothetical protein